MKESVQKKQDQSRAAANRSSKTAQRKKNPSIQLMPEEEEVQMKSKETTQLQEDEELPM